MSGRTLLISPGRDDMGVQNSRMLGISGDVKKDDSLECFGGRGGICTRLALLQRHMII